MRPPNKSTPPSHSSSFADEVSTIGLGPDSLKNLLGFNSFPNDRAWLPHDWDVVPYLETPEESGVLHSDAPDSLETRVTAAEIAEVREKLRMQEEPELDNGPTTIPDATNPDSTPDTVPDVEPSGPDTIPDSLFPSSDTEVPPSVEIPPDSGDGHSELVDSLPPLFDVEDDPSSDDEITLTSERNPLELMTTRGRGPVEIGTEEAAPLPMSKATIRFRLALAFLLGAGVTYGATRIGHSSAHNICIPALESE